MAVTQLSDLVVPTRFTQWTQQRTEQKSALIRSGAVVRDAVLDGLLTTGGGLTFNVPSFRPLVQNDSRAGNDNPLNRIPDDGSGTAPNAHGKITSSTEIAVRLERNFSWSIMSITQGLTGGDPMQAIVDTASDWQGIDDQFLLASTLAGVFADNDAAPTGTDQHTIGDLTLDRSGGAFVEGVTNFSARNFLDARTLMGDSMLDRGLILCHPVVYNRMEKESLVDFIPDNEGGIFRRYRGFDIVVDEMIPNPSGPAGKGLGTAANIYHTWVLAPGAIRMGMGSHPKPVEFWRDPSGGNGAGQDYMYLRSIKAFHPVGHAFIGNLTGLPSGPDYTTAANGLANAASWSRVFPQRKQIKIFRLITREA